MLRRAPLLLLLAAVGCSGGETDFYAIPGDVAEGANGRLLRLQEIDPLAPDSRAFRVLYRSTGIHGEPIAVSGLVAVPDAAPPSDGYDVARSPMKRGARRSTFRHSRRPSRASVGLL